MSSPWTFVVMVTASGWEGAGTTTFMIMCVMCVMSWTRFVASGSLSWDTPWGGGVSVLFSGSWPTDVEGLIVVEGLGPPEESVDDGPARMRRWIKEERQVGARGPRLFSSKHDVARRLMARQPRLTEELAMELAGWLSRESEGSWQWRHDPMHRVRGPKIYLAATYAPFLQKISCPVLLITGSESWYRWPDLADRRSQIPDWRRVDIAEAGHMVHQDQPEALAQAVACFLQGKEPPGATYSA